MHTHTHKQKYVILIAFPRQQRFRERTSIFHYNYIACIVQFLQQKAPLAEDILRHVITVTINSKYRKTGLSICVRDYLVRISVILIELHGLSQFLQANAALLLRLA